MKVAVTSMLKDTATACSRLLIHGRDGVGVGYFLMEDGSGPKGSARTLPAPLFPPCL